MGKWVAEEKHWWGLTMWRKKEKAKKENVWIKAVKNKERQI